MLSLCQKLCQNYLTINKLKDLAKGSYMRSLRKIKWIALGLSALFIGFLEAYYYFVQKVPFVEDFIDWLMGMAVAIVLIIIIFRYVGRLQSRLEQEIIVRKQAEEEREKNIVELQKALAEVKVLQGIIPICASCKKIRDDKGFWQQVEVYIRDHSEVEFSHGLCPECLKKLYPEFYEEEKHEYADQNNNRP